MPALRLPIFDQSLFQQPVEQQVKTLADFIMRYRRELEYLLNGQLDDDNGVFRAATIISNAIVTNVLTAQKGYIAELTVDQIDTSDKVQRYLASDTSPLGYWRGYDQFIEFIEAKIEGTPTTEQVKNRNNESLYWLDGTHAGVTTDVTDFPVLQYIYTELVKLRLYHEIDADTGNAVPKMVWGAGNPAGRQKGYLYKDSTGMVVSYENASGVMREIRLDEDGVFITPYDLEGIAFGSNGFEVVYSGCTFEYTWTKDGYGKITQLQTDGRTIPVTWQ